MQRLLAGHRTVGNWTLAQVCRHLADTINGSMDGMDLRNHRWKRRFFGGLLFRITLRSGIPRGFLVDARLTPPPDSELETSIAMLKRAIGRYQSFTGALQPHPLFGRLSRRNWDRMHRLHCAHHLGFVLPTGS